MGDQAAGVELGHDAVQPQLGAQLGEAVNQARRRAECHLGRQNVIVGKGGQTGGALVPQLGLLNAGGTGIGGVKAPHPPEVVLNAFQRLGAGRLFRQPRIDRNPQRHIAGAGVSGILPGLPISLQVVPQFGYVHTPQANKDGEAGGAGAGEGFRSGGRHSERRMRLLVRQRRHGSVLHLIVLAGVGKGFAPPSLQDDVQRLPKAGAALGVGYAVDVIRTGKTAAPDAEVKPPLADLIHRGNLLGDAERVVQRQHINGHSDAKAARARGNAAGDGDGRGQHRAVGRKVHLGQPGAVQPAALGGIHQLEPLAEGIRGAAAGAGFKLHKHTEVHSDTLHKNRRNRGQRCGWCAGASKAHAIGPVKPAGRRGKVSDWVV